jgi:hypothetical protein
LGSKIEKINALGQVLQKVCKMPFSTNNLDVVMHCCNPSYAGGVGRRIVVRGWLWVKCETLSEK